MRADPSTPPPCPALLAAVLPRASVVVRESTLAARETPLLPEENAVFAGFVAEKRRREFAVGRRCARAALAELGVVDFPLLPGKDRAPIWPAGVVGSITHTEVEPDGYCGVAVAWQEQVQALGVDAEPRHALARDLWPRILDEAEKEAALAAPEPGVYARLVFSAKEAVYKAMYPMYRRFLDFSDVHVECRLEAGEFFADLRENSGRLDAPEVRLLGQFVITRELIVAGLALTAVSLQLPEEELSPQHSPC